MRAYVLAGQADDAVADAKSAEGTKDAKSAATAKLGGELAARRKALRRAKAGPEVEAFVCADWLSRNGETASAERLLAKAGEMPAAHGLRAALAVERGRLVEALPDAEAAVQDAPAEWTGWYARGRVRFERGLDGATADLAKAAESVAAEERPGAGVVGDGAAGRRPTRAGEEGGGRSGQAAPRRRGCARRAGEGPAGGAVKAIEV